MKKLANPPPSWVLPVLCVAYAGGLLAMMLLALGVAP